MNSKYDYDLIRDYLHGVLDKKTAGEIGALIQEDETAHSIALGIIQLDKEFSQEEDAEKYLEEFRQKQMKIIGTALRQSKTSAIPLFKMAAAILLLITVGFTIRWMMMPSLSSLVERELSEAYPEPTLARGEQALSTLEAAYQLYSQKEYAAAAIQFQKIWQQDPEQKSALFYSGLSSMYAGNYQQALTLLKSDAMMDSRFEQQAKWYQALGLIKLGDHTAAKKILEMIASDKNHFKTLEAKKLLRKFK
jgi:tetratricopeptide (TPR) repeat protein